MLLHIKENLTALPVFVGMYRAQNRMRSKRCCCCFYAIRVLFISKLEINPLFSWLFMLFISSASRNAMFIHRVRPCAPTSS